MSLYMIQVSYTAEALAAMARNPQDRRQSIRPMAEKLGARLVDLYFSFGDYDVLSIVEAPDATTAAACAISAAAAGHLKAIKTTVLLTVEEAMEAMRKAGSVALQPPG